MAHGPRMYPRSAETNAVDGRVVWSPVKSLWFSGMAAIGIVGGWLTFSWEVLAMAGILTGFTLCFGHSVGLHRLLVHRSFRCPRWLEYCMVYTGVLVGMGGPRKILYMHDIRDWSQRKPRCHDFYIHRRGILLDWLWNLHCELRLDHPPEFRPEARVTESTFYRLLDRYWMAAQLPLALVLYLAGGWPWVIWGICGRVALSLTGHWLVGYLAHNVGQQDRLVEGAAVQGYNVAGLGVITMGEAWHNNHHAFPESARMGLKKGQSDPGWWLLCRIGLVSHLKTPAELTGEPKRPALASSRAQARKTASREKQVASAG